MFFPITLNSIVWLELNKTSKYIEAILCLNFLLRYKYNYTRDQTNDILKNKIDNFRKDFTI